MKKAVLLVLIAMAFLAAPVSANAAAYFTLTPSSATHSSGDTFTVDLGINSGADKVMSVDVVGTFDAEKLELMSASVIGTAFSPDLSPSINNTSGTFTFMLISSTVDPFQASVLDGGVIKLSFKAKSEGTASVNFTCSGTSYDDSNIFDFDNNDIITCASNQSGLYTITAVGGDTTTDTTTTTTTTATTTTSDELPQTGSLTTIIVLSLIGMVGMAGAFMMRVL